MGVVILRRISEQRQKLILSQAAPHLDPGEEVLDWVRARPAEGRGDGFVFLTEERIIINLRGRHANETSYRWGEIEAWGVIADHDGGPVLVMDTAAGHCLVQVLAATPAMAERASQFVERFAQLAPEVTRRPSGGHHLGDPKPVKTVQVDPRRLSLYDHTWRLLITVLGVAMILTAVVIIPLPGPWSFLIAIAGFAVLAREYDWAKDALEWFKARYRAAAAKLKARRQTST